MESTDAQAPLYTIVRILEGEQLEEWRLRYRSSLALEDAMAQGIKVVETTVARRPGGNILVTVAITAVKAFECEVNVFRLQRAGNHVYKLVGLDES